MAAMVATLDFQLELFYYFFDLQVTLMLPTKFQVNWPFGSEKWKLDFQDGHHGSHLAFLFGTILAIFDLQVTLMTPTKFQVNWLFSSGEGAKNIFKMAVILDFQQEWF